MLGPALWRKKSNLSGLTWLYAGPKIARFDERREQNNLWCLGWRDPFPGSGIQKDISRSRGSAMWYHKMMRNWGYGGSRGILLNGIQIHQMWDILYMGSRGRIQIEKVSVSRQNWQKIVTIYFELKSPVAAEYCRIMQQQQESKTSIKNALCLWRKGPGM